MKKIFIALALITMFTSCKKFLDLPPADQIASNQYWNTASDLENYMLQFYPSLPNFNNTGTHYGPYGVEGDNGSDHEIWGTTVNLQLNGSRAPVQSGGNWSWSNIRSVNIFFENYHKVNAPLVNIQQFIGEAYFFKAFYYFNLVKSYGDVPWYTHSLLMTSPELYKERDPRTMVVDSILWCLDQAIANLNFRSTVSGGNTRLNKEAALIFKSRVALFEGTWQKYHANTVFGTTGADPTKYLQSAVDAVIELMTPGKYTIGIANSGSPSTDYNKLFSSNDLSSNKEVALWCKYDVSLLLTHQMQSDLRYGYFPFVTNQLVENFLRRDGTPYDYITTGITTKGNAYLTKITTECDIRLSTIIMAPGMLYWSKGNTGYFNRPQLYETGNLFNATGYQIRKGLDPSALDGSLAYQNNFITGCPVYRFAEALLNYAEAQAELGQTVNYANSLNLLRARAGLPNFVVISDPLRSKYADFGYTLTDELYEIRRERAVELACEGFRYDDWRRWRAHNLFLNKQPMGYPFLASDYPDYPTLASKFALDANGFILPFKNLLLGAGYNFNLGRDYLDCIPTNEITLNPALTQNPGW
jgi:starch-binding outer membrane protein, SusD/RagB family